jgi:hypothetical protein
MLEVENRPEQRSYAVFMDDASPRPNSPRMKTDGDEGDEEDPQGKKKKDGGHSY